MTSVENRIDRERSFHNLRFSDETREAQDKYYSAIAHGAEGYMALVHSLSAGADVLEYGCAKGGNALALAPTCRSITGIDISDVAISQARGAAAAARSPNAHFFAMNAEEMSFDDDSFDLVFGSGIIHHLDLENSFREIARVLRPSGKAVFWEPLGHNPLINWYRRRTPEARTPDEHPLLKRDFDIARRHFDRMNLRFYGLTTLSGVPFRRSPLHAAVYGVTRAVDRVLLSVPGVKWQAWYVRIVLTAPR